MPMITSKIVSNFPSKMVNSVFLNMLTNIHSSLTTLVWQVSSSVMSIQIRPSHNLLSLGDQVHLVALMEVWDIWDLMVLRYSRRRVRKFHCLAKSIPNIIKVWRCLRITCMLAQFFTTNHSDQISFVFSTRIKTTVLKLLWENFLKFMLWVKKNLKWKSITHKAETISTSLREELKLMS